MSGKKKILLCIDDEATGLMIRKMILERSGYSVLTAQDGPEGLDLFRSEAVDAVVVDYYMPKMDGGTVASTMKKLRPTVPIVMLSAYLNLPEGSLSAVDAFITKGQSPEILLEKLQAILDA